MASRRELSRRDFIRLSAWAAAGGEGATNAPPPPPAPPPEHNKARIEIEYIQGSWGNARD